MLNSAVRLLTPHIDPASFWIESKGFYCWFQNLELSNTWLLFIVRLNCEITSNFQYNPGNLELLSEQETFSNFPRKTSSCHRFFQRKRTKVTELTSSTRPLHPDQTFNGFNTVLLMLCEVISYTNSTLILLPHRIWAEVLWIKVLCLFDLLFKQSLSRLTSLELLLCCCNNNNSQ